MKLSRKKAIKLCIELWTWLAKTGKLKEDWPEWEKYGDIAENCWFCEYDSQQQNYKSNFNLAGCRYCPLIKKLGLHCRDTYYRKWYSAKTPKTRKKYAKLFLKQIKKCK